MVPAVIKYHIHANQHTLEKSRPYKAFAFDSFIFFPSLFFIFGELLNNKMVYYQQVLAFVVYLESVFKWMFIQELDIPLLNRLKSLCLRPSSYQRNQHSYRCINQNRLKLHEFILNFWTFSLKKNIFNNYLGVCDVKNFFN